ncbi:unnamed protein product [Debaryomyces fabryi]|nr:unnamed protein product [Debaryomyces fabryi]
MKAFTILVPLAFLNMVLGENIATFKMDFKVLRGNAKRDIPFDERPYVSKRDSTEMELRNRQTFYLANIEVGSNEDEIGVLVDTGSSDLWVTAHDSNCERSLSKRDIQVDSKLTKMKEDLSRKYPEDNIYDVNQNAAERKGTTSEISLRPVWNINLSDLNLDIRNSGSSYIGNDLKNLKSSDNECTRYGSFRFSDSDTFSRNQSANRFSISYADGTYARGFWGTDNVSFGNITVRDLSFAVSNDTTSDIGILGIGLSGLETTYSNQNGGNYQYENLPLKLRNQGAINKAAYSIYLGDEDSRTGTVLFGAVDSAKYSGDLQTVQIVNSARNYGYSDPIRIEVIVNGISLNDSNTEVEITSNDYTAVLDTGSTFSYFPTSLLSSLGETLNGQFSSSLGAYIVDCIDNNSYFFSIDFSGVRIDVPLTSLIQRYSYNQCFLSILEQSNSDYILFGDNVLRSAYLVIDLDDLEISMAQVRHTTEEDVAVISSSVPNAVRAPGYSSTSLPSSVVESDSPAGTFGSGSNSGGRSGRSSGASMNRFSKGKVYGLFIGLSITVPLFLY